MTKTELEAFLAVLQYGSISAAAERLFITQPAMSRRMKSMEDSPKIKENGNAYQPEEKTVKENRCCMVCWIPCSSGLCCGYYFIRFLNIRR